MTAQPEWTTIGVSVRGSAHERLGLPCQDGWTVRRRGDGGLVVAVADGAGSASHADVGAALASAAAADFLSDASRPANDEECRDTLLGALAHALAAVTARAEEMHVDGRELASTLIAVLVEPGRAAAAQIGDGAAVVGDRQGAIRPLTVPQIGEYLNSTTFLVSQDALSGAQVSVVSGSYPHLAVFTDGIEMLALAMPSGEAHAPFFAPLFAYADAVSDADQGQAQLEALLRSPRVQARTDDDLTLVLGARKR